MIVPAQRLFRRDEVGRERGAGIVLLKTGILEHAQVIARGGEAHDVHAIARFHRKNLLRLDEEAARGIRDEDGPVRASQRGDALDSDAVAVGSAGSELQQRVDAPDGQGQRVGRRRLEHGHVIEAGREHLDAQELPPLVEDRAACAADPDLRVDQMHRQPVTEVRHDDSEAVRSRDDGQKRIRPVADNVLHDALDFDPLTVVPAGKQLCGGDAYGLGHAALTDDPGLALVDDGSEIACAGLAGHVDELARLHRCAGVDHEDAGRRVLDEDEVSRLHPVRHDGPEPDGKAAPRFTGRELADVFDRGEGKTPDSVERPGLRWPVPSDGDVRSSTGRTIASVERDDFPGAHDEAQQVDPDVRPWSSRRC